MWQWESPGPEGCLSRCQSPKEEKEVGGTSEMGEAHKVNKICQELCLGSEGRKCQQHKKYIYMHPDININIHQHICICSSKSFLRQRKARSTNKRCNLLALSSPRLWAISAFQAKYVLIFKAKFPQWVFFHVKVFPVDLCVGEESFRSRDYRGWTNWDAEPSSQFSTDSEQQ